MSVASNQFVGLCIADPIEDGSFLFTLDGTLQFDAMLSQMLQMTDCLQVFELVSDLILLH